MLYIDHQCSNLAVVSVATGRRCPACWPQLTLQRCRNPHPPVAFPQSQYFL